MRILCPVCKMAYTIPEEKFTTPVLKAVCKGCKSKLAIDRHSETARVISETRSRRSTGGSLEGSLPSPSGGASAGGRGAEEVKSRATESEPLLSVSSMSPEYPRRRDALIICVVTAIFIIVLVGGYFLIRGTGTPWLRFTQNPIQYLTRLINGYETYQVCEAFLRRNDNLFRNLGRNRRFSLVREEIRIQKGVKRAKVIIKAEGSEDTKKVLFWLRKRRGRWRISSVAMELENGRFKTVYPKPKS